MYNPEELRKEFYGKFPLPMYNQEKMADFWLQKISDLQKNKVENIQGWEKEFDKIILPLEIQVGEVWKDYIDRYHKKIKSFIRSLFTSLQQKVEERIKLLTDGSMISNKERGDMGADAQYAAIEELRYVLNLFKK